MLRDIQPGPIKLIYKQIIEKEVRGAKNTIPKIKPKARHYLVSCLQDSEAQKEMAKSLLWGYGRTYVDTHSSRKKLYREFAKHSNEFASDGRMHLALILACNRGKLHLKDFKINELEDISVALSPYTTNEPIASELNLLNTNGEQDKNNLEEARLLGELIPSFLNEIEHLQIN